MNSLPLPPAFLQTPGEPTMPWKSWVRAFENYLIASGARAEDFPEERRIALLLHCLGVEGQRVYYSIRPNDDAANTLDDALSVLAAQFSPPENKVAARYKFRQRAQHPGEKVDVWVSALRTLVATCQYRDLEDEMIQDQIIEKTNDSRTRERLLMEPDLTLDRALTIARQIERAREDSRAIAKDQSAGLPFQHSVARVRTSDASAAIPGSRRNRTAPRNNACFCCGKEGHWAKDPACPALRAVCTVCNKVGHFAAVCQSAVGDPTTVASTSARGPVIGRVTYSYEDDPAIADFGNSVEII